MHKYDLYNINNIFNQYYKINKYFLNFYDYYSKFLQSSECFKFQNSYQQLLE